jgi:hypothetical protein
MDGDDRLAPSFPDSLQVSFPRSPQRLSDKILLAFHQACHEADYKVADQLLRALEMVLIGQQVDPGAHNRRNMDSLVAAHERLWQLRHPI